MTRLNLFKVSLIFVFSLLISCKKDKQALIVKELNTNWVFKKVSDSEWLNATVPGTVHTDLIDNKIIEDPYFRLNEHDLQWIDKVAWEYKTTFEITEEEYKIEHIELNFDGLDTYAIVFLNNVEISSTDNMFRSYEIECKKHLKIGSNELRIVLKSPINEGIKKYDALNYTIPVSDNDLAEIGKVENGKKVSVFTRKAGYHYGWDWGPRLVSSGIWRPVSLKFWEEAKIKDVFIQQKLLKNKAALNATVEIESSKIIKNALIKVQINDSIVIFKDVDLTKGRNNCNVAFEINNPKIWWPNGLGEQPLYEIKVELETGVSTGSISTRIGLREIDLITKNENENPNFYFKVNGEQVFMKGVNYIPQDVFLPRVSKEDYVRILSSAKDANMNMIRVWGGGIYENKLFYDLCDEMGLLVWQDFMFACAMFPGDKDFLDNVKEEAKQNVKRLRNHPSIALWCGNNEILSAWKNWGWEQKEIEEQSQETADIIWKAYDDIFHKILPEAVGKYDPDRKYWASSPSSKPGVPENLNTGDAHYWGVWWGKEPFDSYNKLVPSFMSEFGFQSFPTFSSVQKYTNPEDYDVYSDVMKSHQRSSIGNVTIEEYMKRHYKKPINFESFLYVSQLLQAYGIGIGIESHRRNREKCMGSLYWQLNDCWPVASWSGIDYYGKWKALHYKVKSEFENIIISSEREENDLKVFVVSDELTDIESLLNVKLLKLDGTLIETWTKNINIMANSSSLYNIIDLSQFLVGSQTKNSIIHVSLNNKEGLLSEKLIYLEEFKNLNLLDPEISFQVTESENNFKLELSAENIALGVFLSSKNPNNFSENFFDLLPGTKKIVSIEKSGSVSLNEFKKTLKIVSLKNSY